MEVGPIASAGMSRQRSIDFLDSSMLHTEKDLHEVLIYKEQELKELQACQMHFQKTALQDTRKQLEEMHRKFNSLKEDFTYNLRVLEERDRELKHYDTLFMQLKMVENAKQAEISELKIQVDKLEQALAQESKKQAALQYQYQQKLKEHQLELKHIHSTKDSDISLYREEYENTKHQLERKLQEVEGELALQRQELLVEFDAEIKKREYEFRQKADEMSNVVLSHELKVKLLTKELEALKEAGIKAAESLKMAEAINLELEKEVKSKDWEIKDLAAVKDVQIQDLESKLHSLQMSWKKEKELFERKHATIDHFAREKDVMLSSMKEAHAEQKHKWENQIRELQMHNETLEIKLHQAEWRHTDFLKEKDAVIEELKKELEAMKTTCDSQVAQMSRETVSKDVQIHSLQEEEIKLKTQLATLSQDIERYKQQLSIAAEREESLERAKIQIELDWQRRCETVERNQYQKSEALIQSLSTTRDQIAAKLQEKEKKLHELEVAMSVNTIGVVGQDFPSAEIQRLQEQNSTLRTVISEMRREMERLNNQASDHSQGKIQDVDRADSAAVSVTLDNKPFKVILIAAEHSTEHFSPPDYVQSLEKDTRLVKEKCWTTDKQHENPPNLPGKSFVFSQNSSSCNKSAQTSYQDYIINGRDDNIATKTNVRNHSIGALQVDSVGTLETQMQLLGMGAGDGPHQHTENSTRLQNRLKEAARKICSLSKEKQQLLEMVNRLRAEFGTASTEGSLDSKHSEQHQGHTFHAALYPKELVRETRHRLVALEQLQYQLTTQELQRSHQKCVLRKSPHFVEKTKNESVPGSNSCTEREEMPLKEIPVESFERNSNALKHEMSVTHQTQQYQKRRPGHFQPGILSSSGTQSSLEEIWQILEMGSSPSVLSSQSNNDQEKFQIVHEPERLEDSQENSQIKHAQKVPAGPLNIMGTAFHVHSKPKKLSYKQSRKSQISPQITKIRNYNIKD
nr:PREDICTED: coiled-coil domain-containing protein 57 isoform X2 [Anolis carolinensis]|eukprot:XP_016846875.1 PREDICTED: coiled-coil domain-containing protein 57 isoform X2 [Anolis carolinensis]